jgi:hypothetical protein
MYYSAMGNLSVTDGNENGTFTNEKVPFEFLQPD